MKLIILLLCVILLAGCGDIEPPLLTPDRQQEVDLKDCQVERDELRVQIGILETAKEEIIINQNEYNKLITDYHALQTQYVILEAYSQTIRDQYTNLLNQFSTRYVDSGERYTELYKMNMKLVESYKELDGQIEAVHKEKVPLLSDNLTEIEYNAFYKGWKLWWGEFND